MSRAPEHENECARRPRWTWRPQPSATMVIFVLGKRREAAAARSDENGYVMMINEGPVVYLGIEPFKTPAATHYHTGSLLPSAPLRPSSDFLLLLFSGTLEGICVWLLACQLVSSSHTPHLPKSQHQQRHPSGLVLSLPPLTPYYVSCCFHLLVPSRCVLRCRAGFAARSRWPACEGTWRPCPRHQAIAQTRSLARAG